MVSFEYQQVFKLESATLKFISCKVSIVKELFIGIFIVIVGKVASKIIVLVSV